MKQAVQKSGKGSESFQGIESDTRLKPTFDRIVERVSRVILGKEEEIRLALTCLFAQGHLLIEDLPGIGKTTLAKALSRVLGLRFQRIQCTSDMLPGDILGVSVFEARSSSFVFHPGPVFTQVLLADEINRATPKTQSALLEAMEEAQVTVEGQTRNLDRPFFVIATQNPLEQAGTFPLPESQLDRFLMRIALGYPGKEAELALLNEGSTHREAVLVEPALSPNEVLSIQKRVMQVHASAAIVEYVQKILEFSRNSPEFHIGLSPRAGIAILKAARSRALLTGREYVLPEDVQYILFPVAGHRLRLADDLKEVSRSRLKALFQQVPVP